MELESLEKNFKIKNKLCVNLYVPRRLINVFRWNRFFPYLQNRLDFEIFFHKIIDGRLTAR